jgi:alpha,alpha-trehalose-phosphate synthase [UDP-forming]
MVVSKNQLLELVNDKLRDYSFIIVSNRQPYIHKHEGSKIKLFTPASGLTLALDPVMKACGGTWVAHGSGNADREVVDANSKVGVPPADPKYTLRRVWLSKAEEDGYYYGFSNEGLWPLCHIAYVRPTFNESDWELYKHVNKKFADAILEETKGQKALVFIQDYHFALVSKYLKEKNPDIICAQFWHIPWPNREAFRICPWQEEILDGLLGNDLLGFHVQYHCNNFLDTVDQTLESRVDRARFEVTRGGKTTLVLPFPISVDFDTISKEARAPDMKKKIAKFKSEHGIKDERIGLGVDRVDYTKGLPERFRAIDRFLERHPEHHKKFVFIQVGSPSRTRIDRYQQIGEEIDELVEEINWKYQDGPWRPIIYLDEHIPQEIVRVLYRLADFCVVSSLHDGMNMVAKEYVASRFDEKGVLILSKFTGASRELGDALLINPYAIDEFADTMRQAMEMTEEEEQHRMQKLRAAVSENNIFKWASDVINQLLKFEFHNSNQ